MISQVALSSVKLLCSCRSPLMTQVGQSTVLPRGSQICFRFSIFLRIHSTLFFLASTIQHVSHSTHGRSSSAAWARQDSGAL